MSALGQHSTQSLAVYHGRHQTRSFSIWWGRSVPLVHSDLICPGWWFLLCIHVDSLFLWLCWWWTLHHCWFGLLEAYRDEYRLLEVYFSVIGVYFESITFACLLESVLLIFFQSDWSNKVCMTSLTCKSPRIPFKSFLVQGMYDGLNVVAAMNTEKRLGGGIDEPPAWVQNEDKLD